MPTPYIKKLSKEGKGTVKELEKKWDAAKQEAGPDNYAVTTTIFKKMIGARSRLRLMKELDDKQT